MVGVTLQEQSGPYPYLALRAFPGTMGEGIAVEEAVEPKSETLPVTHESGQGVTSFVVAPKKEVMKTSSARSELAATASIARVASRPLIAGRR